MPNAKDEVSWLIAKDKPHALHGHYAILYPKERWSIVPGLEELLALYEDPALVDVYGALSDDQWRALLKALDWTEIRLLSAMRHKSDDPRSIWTNSAKYERSSRVVPLVHEGQGLLRIDRSLPRGLLVLSDAPYTPETAIRIGNSILRESTGDFPAKLIYDPEHEEIIKIGVYSYTVRPN